VPPLSKLEEYNEIVNKCKSIYMRFFYGDPLSEYETDIESRYLMLKQRKYLTWLNTNVRISFAKSDILEKSV
jgi:hypothetical protein